MTKIARDALAFAARVRMSQNRLFLLVEGRERDVRFYDKLLGASTVLEAHGYAIQLGEQIAINGVAAGGKRHLEKLLDLYRRKGLLRQSGPSGDHIVAFALDKDFDDLLGKRRISDHVVYTKHADVDAEIFARCRPRKTYATALSLDSKDAKAFSRHVQDPVHELARIWEGWIELCVRTEACGARCSIKTSAPSMVNSGIYGSSDASTFRSLEAEMRSRSKRSSGRDKQIQGRYRAAVDRGESRYFVKGKAVPGFLAHEAQKFFASKRPVASKSFRDSVTSVALGTIRFEGTWLRHWLDPLERL
ncbi:hypothetical protein Q6348_07585 [Isoptericola sp. b441]|uniref:DUF4435 domain-containing protein n=1 Tax=Actinotalea lenta TaxID=3064654 RepID=A0ABT9D855_9CELL|nr:hypothetical protein [Isoptericola sp. b441]MDO8107058.1 hypothetical protein [Isoptericola sp. b441]